MRRGRARPYESLTPEECISVPVWEMALDGSEDDDPEQDESWRRPLVGQFDVSPELGDVYCTFRIIGTDFVATALRDPTVDALYEILIWSDGEWEVPKRVAGLPNPIRLECVCMIDGVERATYTSEGAPRNYEAIREAASAA